MTNFRLFNRIAGLFVFLFSSIVYLLTVQPTMSFWDCGEFLACAFTLSIPHPPGAPLHILVGKIFTMFPFVSDIGLRMNLLSVFSSSIGALLLYLISVKVINNWKGLPKTSFDAIIVTVASAIGALSYAFCDSYWFNAMEAEVYGFGTLLVTLCIYTLMIWWERADEPGSDRYLLFFAYIVGLSIGIHLLVVQCVFIAGLFFYFRRYNYTPKSFLIAIISSSIAFFAVYPFIVKKLPAAISSFPVLGGILILAALLIGVYFSIQKKSAPLNLLFLSLFLIIIGYSTYIMVLQRSGVNNLPIDQNNPDNMERLLSYLNREQYGEQPLLFPRRHSHDPMHTATWKNYSSDMDFMWRYQINQMFNRYLFWQYIGRAGYDQNDGVDFSKFFAIPFIFGLFGMFYQFRKDWKLAIVFLAMFILMGVVTALYQNQQDPQPRERDYFYEGAFFVYSLWIGLGVFGIVDLIKEKMKASNFIPATSAVLLVAFIFVPINMLRINYSYQSRAGNYLAFDYAYNLLQSVDKNAILITNGDNDTFPLWCLQATYGIRQDVRIVNLSLGQMDWYNFQLKNEKPYGSLPVPFTYSNEQIAKISKQGYMLWDENKLVSIDVPIKAYPDSLKNKPDKLIFKIPATIRQQDGKQTITALKVNDIMLLDILKANKWERPFYFSVTVAPENYIGLGEYLVTEGMAQRLLPYKIANSSGVTVNENLMKQQLFTDKNITPSKTYKPGFLFRGIDDKNIFYDQTQRRMIEMYRTLYVWLANTYAEDSTKYNMVNVTLDNMEKNIPKSVINMDYRQKYQIAMVYGKIQDMKKFEEYARESYAEAYSERKKYANNLQSFYNPYRILLDICEARGDFKTGLELLKELNQNDASVKQKTEIFNFKLSGGQKNNTQVPKISPDNDNIP